MNDIQVPKTRINLEKLGLLNQGLFPVEGVLAQRYHAVLKQVLGLDCPVDSFRVDKRGLSPELIEFFEGQKDLDFKHGENYLSLQSASRFMIVVSPEQRSAPLIAEQTSFDDDLISSVYTQAKETIEDVTQGEALFGELNTGIRIFQSVDDLLHVNSVEVSLDTLEGTVQKVLALKQMVKTLGDGTNALDDDYLKQMQVLASQVGDVRQRAVSAIFPIREEAHSFYSEFFGGVYSLRNFRNPDKVRALFISTSHPLETDFGQGVLTLQADDPKVLELLHKYGFLKYSADLIPQRLQELEDSFLLEKELDLVELSPHERQRLLAEDHSLLSDEWRALRTVANILSNTKRKLDDVIGEQSYEVRLKLSVANKKPKIINHLLAALDPSDPVRLYTANRKKFLDYFSLSSPSRKRYMAYEVLSAQHRGGL